MLVYQKAKAISCIPFDDVSKELNAVGGLDIVAGEVVLQKGGVCGLRKMFGIEALVVAGRPLLITLPLTVIAVGFMIKASYLNPVEFIKEAPMIPIIVFCFAIFAFVALAYYIGGRRIFQCSLVDALRDDTIM